MKASLDRKISTTKQSQSFLFYFSGVVHFFYWLAFGKTHFFGRGFRIIVEHRAGQSLAAEGCQYEASIISCDIS